MQLYALDENKRLVYADHAQKQVDYRCFECDQTVRLRAGMHRRWHFFHAEGRRACKLGGKTIEHLQVQCAIQQLLGAENCQLERRFPEINRIADVVWEPKKWIFEVQCSPITEAEVAQRNLDYSSIGYQVIWILHTKTFDGYLVSAAEASLQHYPHYYTNIDADGQGGIFDRFQIIKNGRRVAHLEPLPVHLDQPLQSHATLLRPTAWSFRFRGDLSHASEDYTTRALALMQKHRDPLPLPESLFYRFIARPYQLVFQLWLEKLCR